MAAGSARAERCTLFNVNGHNSYSYVCYIFDITCLFKKNEDRYVWPYRLIGLWFSYIGKNKKMPLCKY